MLYGIDNTDLNQDIFNNFFGYYVISDLGPQGGYLQRLSFDIRGVKFHKIDMIRVRT